MRRGVTRRRHRRLALMENTYQVCATDGRALADACSLLIADRRRLVHERERILQELKDTLRRSASYIRGAP